MAPEIVWSEVPAARDTGVLTVLDPMAGSGTTIASARLLGHRAIGFDTDPLAVMIARAWAANVDSEQLLDNAALVVANARGIAADITQGDAYPSNADEETREFVRFWFDPVARVQLSAIAHSIRTVAERPVRELLWCALSRLIITKDAGVSLAMDVSHSRPHRVFEKAPRKAFDHYYNAARYIARGAPFSKQSAEPPAEVSAGDARALRLSDGSVNWVVTSPPYLNAIDYMRGHRLSLVWLGHQVASLRHIRTTNVGTEALTSGSDVVNPHVRQALEAMGEAGQHSGRTYRMLRGYVVDMDRVMREIARVLVPGGQAVLVVGDSTIRGVFVSNSSAIATLGSGCGLALMSSTTRELPSNRRYLPPPGLKNPNGAFDGRMRQEVILKFTKETSCPR